jgi:cysteine desulfurase / selenocysteine lyase
MNSQIGTTNRSWARVREDFPYASECVYLNTAAAGLAWIGEGVAAARFYDGAKRRGMNGMAEWREVRDRATARLAALLGVAESEIDYVGSTTEGLNLVASAMRWAPGDEIIVPDDAFPSVLRACEGTHATVRRVRVPAESERCATLIDALRPNTRMLAAAHVHWATGTRLDLERLSAACRANGTLLMIDGVQAIGAVEPTLADTDVYCASTFKWLLSGFGLGIVVVRDGVRDQLEPAMRGYNNPAPSTELHYSHVNYPAIYALDASLQYLESIGWPEIYARVDELANALMDALGPLGIPVVTPRDAHAGIVSCVVSDPEAVRDALAREGIHVEARDGLLRISPHIYNDHDDIRAVAEALPVAVERGA